jgi:glycosyltransferase involved in cell wall biosynthesis
MKWTFGIPVKSCVYLRQTLNSIVNQEGLLPSDCEIILVGEKTDELVRTCESFADRKIDLLFVQFDETQVPGWITRKKNIVTQLASNENICYMHDYVGLCRGWYQGFLHFDQEWDVCMNCVRSMDGTRFRDWVLSTVWWGGPKYLPYDDSSRTNEMYVSGTYWCAKKSFMLAHPLDERRVWGQGEDVEWSTRCRNLWNYRMNRQSSVRF